MLCKNFWFVDNRKSIIWVLCNNKTTTTDTGHITLMQYAPDPLPSLALVEQVTCCDLFDDDNIPVPLPDEEMAVDPMEFADVMQQIDPLTEPVVKFVVYLPRRHLSSEFTYNDAFPTESGYVDFESNLQNLPLETRAFSADSDGMILKVRRHIWLDVVTYATIQSMVEVYAQTHVLGDDIALVLSTGDAVNVVVSEDGHIDDDKVMHTDLNGFAMANTLRVPTRYFV